MNQPLTRDEITLKYRADHPILDAYLSATEEHSAFTSINSPNQGIDVRQATRIALQRIGRPAQDLFDVDTAYAFIRSLLDEAERLFPPQDKDLAYYVTAGFFPFAGYVPTADEWESYPDDEQAMHINDALEGISDHSDELRAFLVEALKYGMPAILRHITENDEVKRRMLRAIPTTDPAA